MTVITVEPRRPANLSQIIDSELIRAKHTVLQLFPLIGLFLGIISSTFAFFASGAHDASGTLGWQAMYVTGMAAPLMALIPALAEDREKTNHHGGIDLRAVSPNIVRLARILVLIVISAFFHLLNFGSAWVIVFTQGREGSQSLLVAGLLSFIGSIPTIALFDVIARYLSITISLLISIAYQVVGTLFAESSVWTLLPPTWPVRMLLPVLGVHSNAVPLDSGDSLYDESSVHALILVIIFSALAIIAAVTVKMPRPRVTKKTKSRKQNNVIGNHSFPDGPFAGQKAMSYSPRNSASNLATVLSALNIVLRRSGVLWLAVTTVLVLFLMVFLYPATYISGIYTFFILPLGAGFTPVITWRLLSSSWYISVLETEKVRLAYIVWQVTLFMSLALVTGTFFWLAGGPLSVLIRLVLLWTTTGVILSLVSTAICISYGVGPTISWSVLITVVSATLGGDVLAHTILWIIAVPAWPEIADTSQRIVIATTLQLLLIILSTRWVLSALKRFERTAKLVY